MESVLQNIRSEIGRLVVQDPFLATIILALKVEVTKSPDILAGTDGVSLVFNEDFWSSLNRRQKRTLLAHEALHVANFHDLRQGSREHRLWNEACDWAINHHLIGSGYQFPPEGCTDPARLQELGGKSAEEIYQILQRERQEQKDEEEQEGGQEALEGDQEGEDPSEGSEGSSGASEGDQEGEGEGEASSDPSGGSEGSSGDPAQWGEINQNPEKEAGKEEERRQLVQDAIDAGKMAGTIPQGFEREFHLLLQPTVDWTAILANYIEGKVSTDWSWLSPNPKYFETPVIMPSLESDAFGEFIFALDTSGSMDEEAISLGIREFLECVGTYGDNGQDMEIKVMMCDTKVHDIQTITDESDLILPKGGGGTRFDPVFDKIKEEGDDPACLIYITDGYATPPEEEPPYDVLWFLTEANPYFAPSFGKILVIGGDS